MRKYLILSCVAAAASALVSCQSPDKSDYSIIPFPNNLEPKCGEFTINESTKVIYDDDLSKEEIAVIDKFAQNLSLVTGYNIVAAVEGESDDNAIKFDKDNEILKEGYELDIDKGEVSVEASSPSGFFYAIQTIKQLLPVEVYGDKKADNVSWTMQAVDIKDQPRIGYRGMHFDVSRHMFTIEEIKSFLDLMAMHKLNTFHWHLTDDQGWRIEIKSYPKLTEIGAWRNETAAGKYEEHRYDGKPYGGFYTQDQIREIVAYAAENQIEVIPEIDMPGHMVAAVASYPYLSCTGKQYDVRTTWGVSDEVLCAGDERVYTFVENVLKEVIELFPSKYVHIGGDECPRVRWEKCPKCQAKIKKEGIKGDSIHTAESYLQSYFNNRIEKFLAGYDKKLIGWDEILEGEISTTATVMSWRGESGGIEAAKKGHDVIMTPNTFLYFDYYQSMYTENEPLAIGGHLPVELVYGYDPIPASFTPEEAARVIGVQANIWTEYIPTFSQLEYMTLPRMDALSEVAWTNLENKDWLSFIKRLGKNLEVYELKGHNYAKHLLDVIVEEKHLTESGAIEVTLRTLGNAPIYYTLDGSDVTTASILYTKPVVIKGDATIRAAAERGGEFSNEFTQTYTFNKATARDIQVEQEIDGQYKYDGAMLLVNGLKGSIAFNSGRWIAFKGNDLVATINLVDETEVSEVSLGYLFDVANWIFPPKNLKVSISNDGKTFTEVANVAIEQPAKYLEIQECREAVAKFDTVKAKYIKVEAESVKLAPEWHTRGFGKPQFLFVDEIIVK